MESASDFIECFIKGLFLSCVGMSIIFYAGGGATENITQNSAVFFLPLISIAVFNRVLGAAVNRMVKYSYTFIVLGFSGMAVLGIRNALPSNLDGFWSIFSLFITTCIFTAINVPDDTRLIAWNVVYIFFFPRGK